MSIVRFATANAVFEMFPFARQKIATAPTDDPPLDFARNLIEKDKPAEAMAFCSYLLPRREAVWWACKSVRAQLGDGSGRDLACLEAAEAWVKEPDFEHRALAEAAGERADPNDELTWLARAAAWSGGALAIGNGARIAPPPELTPHAAQVAILLSLRYLKPAQQNLRLQACVEEGIKLAETGLQ
ncbi:MAG TPA: hypothetical protein VGD36_17865 [Xanthobacteraceae bacterium]|jgi:hypothetical protein